MGGQLLFELLQDRTFLLFLSNFSELSGEQDVYKRQAVG